MQKSNEMLKELNKNNMDSLNTRVQTYNSAALSSRYGKSLINNKENHFNEKPKSNQDQLLQQKLQNTWKTAGSYKQKTDGVIFTQASENIHIELKQQWPRIDVNNWSESLIFKEQNDKIREGHNPSQHVNIEDKLKVNGVLNMNERYIFAQQQDKGKNENILVKEEFISQQSMDLLLRENEFVDRFMQHIQMEKQMYRQSCDFILKYVYEQFMISLNKIMTQIDNEYAQFIQLYTDFKNTTIQFKNISNTITHQQSSQSYQTMYEQQKQIIITTESLSNRIYKQLNAFQSHNIKDSSLQLFFQIVDQMKPAQQNDSSSFNLLGKSTVSLLESQISPQHALIKQKCNNHTKQTSFDKKVVLPHNQEIVKRDSDQLDTVSIEKLAHLEQLQLLKFNKDNVKSNFDKHNVSDHNTSDHVSDHNISGHNVSHHVSDHNVSNHNVSDHNSSSNQLSQYQAPYMFRDNEDVYEEIQGKTERAEIQDRAESSERSGSIYSATNSQIMSQQNLKIPLSEKNNNDKISLIQTNKPAITPLSMQQRVQIKDYKIYNSLNEGLIDEVLMAPPISSQIQNKQNKPRINPEICNKYMTDSCSERTNKSSTSQNTNKSFQFDNISKRGGLNQNFNIYQDIPLNMSHIGNQQIDNLNESIQKLGLFNDQNQADSIKLIQNSSVPPPRQAAKPPTPTNSLQKNRNQVQSKHIQHNIFSEVDLRNFRDDIQRRAESSGCSFENSLNDSKSLFENTKKKTFNFTRKNSRGNLQMSTISDSNKKKDDFNIQICDFEMSQVSIPSSNKGITSECAQNRCSSRIRFDNSKEQKYDALEQEGYVRQSVRQRTSSMIATNLNEDPYAQGSTRRYSMQERTTFAANDLGLERQMTEIQNSPENIMKIDNKYIPHLGDYYKIREHNVRSIDIQKPHTFKLNTKSKITSCVWVIEETFALGTVDGFLSIYDTCKGRGEVERMELGRPIAKILRISERLLAVSSFGSYGISILDIFSRKLTRELAGHSEEIRDIMFIHPNVIMSSSQDGCMIVWQDFEISHKKQHKQEIHILQASSDYSKLFCVDITNQIIIYSLQRKPIEMDTTILDNSRIHDIRLEKIIKTSSSYITTLNASFSNKNILICGMQDGNIRIYDVRTDNILTNLKASLSPLMNIIILEKEQHVNVRESGPAYIMLAGSESDDDLVSFSNDSDKTDIISTNSKYNNTGKGGSSLFLILAHNQDNTKPKLFTLDQQNSSFTLWNIVYN